MLEAAIRRFWEHGYEGTSIGDLTEATGVTAPTLYAAFGSKEALFEACLDGFAERIWPERLRRLRENESAYDAIAFYLTDSARQFAGEQGPKGCLVASAALQVATDNQSISDMVARLRAETLANLAGCLERGKARGDLPDDTDTAGLARFYYAVTQGMAVQARDGATAKELMPVVENAMKAWPG